MPHSVAQRPRPFQFRLKLYSGACYAKPLQLIVKGGNMSTSSSLVVIPDSLLAKEATDILREHSTELLFNHSMRVYLFAAEQGRQQKLRFDPELLYAAAAFHDFGLTTCALK